MLSKNFPLHSDQNFHQKSGQNVFSRGCFSAQRKKLQKKNEVVKTLTHKKNV